MRSSGKFFAHTSRTSLAQVSHSCHPCWGGGGGDLDPCMSHTMLPFPSRVSSSNRRKMSDKVQQLRGSRRGVKSVEGREERRAIAKVHFEHPAPYPSHPSLPNPFPCTPHSPLPNHPSQAPFHPPFLNPFPFTPDLPLYPPPLPALAPPTPAVFSPRGLLLFICSVFLWLISGVFFFGDSQHSNPF